MEEKHIYIAGVMDDEELRKREPKASVIGMYDSLKQAISAVKNWHSTAHLMLAPKSSRYLIYTIETVTINTESPESADIPLFYKGNSEPAVWCVSMEFLEDKGPFTYTA